MSYEELVKKAFEALEKTPLEYRNDSAAVAGVGYAILALAETIRETSATK